MIKNEVIHVPFDEIEIIELDERLDMAVDPVLGLFRPDANYFCGSNCKGDNAVCGFSCC